MNDNTINGRPVKSEELVRVKKILFIVNVVGKISNFIIPSIEAGHNLGFEFHIASNLSRFRGNMDDYNVVFHHVDIIRNPFNLKNIRAYKQMLDLMKKEQFDAIHCNTPAGGVLGRFCGRAAKVPKIIYTAHGFHFYKGAPPVAGIYKMAEVVMARDTDVILTMNNEDYDAAQKFNLRKGGNVYYIPGVGVNTESYRNVEVNRIQLRESLGIKEDDIALIALGELIDRKNYQASIKAVARANNQKLHFFICGRGAKHEELKELVVKLKVEDQVHFLGYRTDVKELLSVADIFFFTTHQEGLARSMMEAMSAGLPCVASKVRGNVDLIEEGIGGFLRHPDDADGFAQALNILADDEDLRKEMSASNLETIKKFDVGIVKQEMLRIYERELL